MKKERYAHPNAITRRYHLKRLNIIVSKIRLVTRGSTNLTFLDVGCGDGTYESLLEKDFDYLVGLDFTLNDLKIAKEHTRDKSKVDFVLADAKNLPLKDLSVDVVLCSEVLEHLHDPIKALRELLHVFQNTLLLTVPAITLGRKLAKPLQYSVRLQKIETGIGHVSMHDSRWWTNIIYRTIKVKQAKWRVEIDHLYISAEPFTTMFAHLKNRMIFSAIDKTLNIFERILSRPLFANHLMFMLTVR